MAGSRKEFFLRIAALMSSQGNMHLLEELSTLSHQFPWLFKLSSALTSSVPDFDGQQGRLTFMEGELSSLLCVCVCMWLVLQNKTTRPAAFMRYTHLHHDVVPNY